MIGRPVLARAFRPATILPLGFTDATPADRRQLAGLSAALALAAVAAYGELRRGAGFAELLAADPLRFAGAVVALVLAVSCAVLAGLHWTSARTPAYLGPPTMLTDIWEVIPGERLGPLALGPLSVEAVQLLRRHAGFVYVGPSTVLCALRHWQGVTLVRVRTADPASDGSPPDPMRFAAIERIMTTSPIHLGPGGLRVGMPMPHATALLGLPDAITPPSSVVARRRQLEYREGLELTVSGNEVGAIQVFPAGDAVG